MLQFQGKNLPKGGACKPLSPKGAEQTQQKGAKIHSSIPKILLIQDKYMYYFFPPQGVKYQISSELQNLKPGLEICLDFFKAKFKAEQKKSQIISGFQVQSSQVVQKAGKSS